MLPKNTIFISHSSKDKGIVSALVNYLEKRKLSCWLSSRDIMPGKEYAESIIEGIDNSSLMIVVLSASSNESKHVRNEVERAFHKHVAIVPFRIEDITPSRSLEYFLSSTHWLDAINGNPEKYFEKVHNTCLQLIDKVKASPGTITNKTPKEPIVNTPVTKEKLTAADQILPKKRFLKTRAGIVLSVFIACAAAILLYFILSKRSNSIDTNSAQVNKPDSSVVVKPAPDTANISRSVEQNKIIPGGNVAKPTEANDEDDKIITSPEAKATLKDIDGLTFREGAASPNYIRFFGAENSTINFKGKINIYDISGVAKFRNNKLIISTDDTKGTLTLSMQPLQLNGNLVVDGEFKLPVINYTILH